MKNPAEPSVKPLKGLGTLFDDAERKELFKKYLYFLGWVEILIFVICWLYQLGDGGHDRFGPVETTFPWKTYFLVAFLTPVAITFLVGMVIVGFNKYFGDTEAGTASSVQDGDAPAEGKADRIHKINRMVNLLQRLPYLALLLLLGTAVAFFYKIDVILGFIGTVGEQSVRILLLSAAVVLALASVFALILIVLNYQLRKRSMEYQYKSEVAERFGLIILEDNTVLNSEGKLLINGRKKKDAIALLPAKTSESPGTETSGRPIPRPVDLETT